MLTNIEPEAEVAPGATIEAPALPEAAAGAELVLQPATDRGNRLRDAMRAAAGRADIPTRACTNYTSDHWSYAKAGVSAVRLGSIPYAGYHSRGDVPSLVDRRQLDRVGRTVWAWLQTLN